MAQLVFGDSSTFPGFLLPWDTDLEEVFLNGWSESPYFQLRPLRQMFIIRLHVQPYTGTAHVQTGHRDWFSSLVFLQLRLINCITMYTAYRVEDRPWKHHISEDVLLEARKPSTRSSYNRKWSRFENWILNEDDCPFIWSLSSIVDHLFSLAQSGLSCPLWRCT